MNAMKKTRTNYQSDKKDSTKNVGAAVASLFGENPEQQFEEDLRKFKEMMESGEAKAV